jgi:hypothetical protein
MTIRKFPFKIKAKSSLSLRLSKAVDNDVDLRPSNGIQGIEFGMRNAEVGKQKTSVGQMAKIRQGVEQVRDQ